METNLGCCALNKSNFNHLKVTHSLTLSGQIDRLQASGPTLLYSDKESLTPVEMRVLLVVASLVALCGAEFEIQYEFVEEWRLWKAQHGKDYLTQPEELERHLVWLSNRKYIELHNKNADIFGYKLTMNAFGDLVWLVYYSHKCVARDNFPACVNAPPVLLWLDSCRVQ